MPKVTILPHKKTIEVPEGANLREELVRQDIYVKSTCGGVASCGLCVAVVNSGEDYLNEFSFEEKQLLGNVFHITKERLTCQTIVMGDIEIDLSAHEQEITKKTIRKSRDQLKAEKLEREEAPAKEPRQGGFKRPKAFKTED